MMDSGTPLGHRIVKQLHGIASRLTGDFDLQKDLMQEMFIHLVQVEADQPGQTVSWYLQGCHFRARAYLDRGRSINSIKRGNDLVSLDEGDDDSDGSPFVCLDVSDPNDLQSELIARDIVDLLVPQLTDVQQQILFLLMDGFGICEIARELRVSHPAIIKHRKRIAHIASALLADSACLDFRNGSNGRSLVHTSPPRQIVLGSNPRNRASGKDRMAPVRFPSRLSCREKDPIRNGESACPECFEVRMDSPTRTTDSNQLMQTS
jgi:DNA-directed RNA polymerase specialized sigma24 family protein